LSRMAIFGYTNNKHDCKGERAAMMLNVTEQAVACLKDEWGFEAGESVRVYVRYAGGSPEGFVFGIQKDQPSGNGQPIQAEAGGIAFFIEEGDQWFMQGPKLTSDAAGLAIT